MNTLGSGLTYGYSLWKRKAGPWPIWLPGTVRIQSGRRPIASAANLGARDRGAGRWELEGISTNTHKSSLTPLLCYTCAHIAHIDVPLEVNIHEYYAFSRG